VTKIRGYLGEQSFEIADGDAIVDRYCEAMVFSSAYRVALKLKRSTPDARLTAREAVLAFRETKE
jgi:hypothetical protein